MGKTKVEHDEFEVLVSMVSLALGYDETFQNGRALKTESGDR